MMLELLSNKLREDTSINLSGCALKDTKYLFQNIERRKNFRIGLPINIKRWKKDLFKISWDAIKQ